MVQVNPVPGFHIEFDITDILKNLQEMSLACKIVNKSSINFFFESQNT